MSLSLFWEKIENMSGERAEEEGETILSRWEPDGVLVLTTSHDL